ncbi:MAG TPA: bifunctional diguanylate cyclase/phosphodiesterase [Xanthobacteraceae bacterium]|jgi:diguanylate cyclase (GGDEF)-like protein
MVRTDGRLPAARPRSASSSQYTHLDAFPGAAPATGSEASIQRLVVPLAIVLVVATIVCLGLGFVWARQADERGEAGHRQALRGAVEALQAVAPDLSGNDPRIIRILKEASGLKELRFDDDPPRDDRETQTLLDRNGRIVGWLNWDPERPAMTTMNGLSPFVVLIDFGFVSLLAAALWRWRRLDRRLTTSQQQMRTYLAVEPVTGLPNGDDILNRLERAAAARQDDKCLAFVILDLDGFLDAKDAVGEAGGDEVLFEIANRLRQAMAPGVVIGRLRNNHKFALMMTASDPQAALATAEAARLAVSRPIWIGQALQVSASLGLAVAPRDGTKAEELLRRAELAFRSARRRGGGMVVGFAPGMEAEFEEQRFIKRELGRALAARDFDVHYQPIVAAEGNAIVGLEALLRWYHPSRGAIPPARFIPIAEQAGLMDQLGELVLRRALTDAARWPDLYVAVNLSPMQVRDRKFVDRVAAILAESKIAPARLVLEVTEGVLIDNPETAKSRLDELRALGLKLALDDFGSGYSSLTYLQRLPFDKLKVDRGFVAALEHSANAGVIIQAVIALGRALNLSILVEGIETEEQRALVRLAGCDEMQGYLFARPVPREEIDRLLTRRNGSRNVTGKPTSNTAQSAARAGMAMGAG